MPTPLDSPGRPARELNLQDERLLTPKEAASFLRVSDSWLAKARMRGDGPPFLKVGRSIRYSRAALVQWLNGQLRSSTSERD
jgi:predicted DNA-binding transcriptional regulator AlpA